MRAPKSPGLQSGRPCEAEQAIALASRQEPYTSLKRQRGSPDPLRVVRGRVAKSFGLGDVISIADRRRCGRASVAVDSPA
jgi:hypothetical protein